VNSDMCKYRSFILKVSIRTQLVLDVKVISDVTIESSWQNLR